MLNKTVHISIKYKFNKPYEDRNKFRLYPVKNRTGKYSIIENEAEKTIFLSISLIGRKSDQHCLQDSIVIFTTIPVCQLLGT